MANEVKITFVTEDKTSKSVSTINDKLEFMKKQLVAVAAVAGTFKKAFDLSYEGAQFIQTGRSFDLLMDKVGAAPNLLEQLTEASRGTISQMELMSSTATLLAGANGNLATALANSTPQLMEIAKAANKLNPALGDTSFMYQSLATGIKRASPLILDNLGLTVKIGEANQKMADSLGINVEQLTAEQQKMALLNATLEAGQILIDQVGGSTDSMTDSLDRLTTKIDDATNAVKAWLANGLIPYLEIMSGGSLNVNDALAEHEEHIREIASDYDEYSREMVRAYDAAGKQIKINKDGIAVMHVGRGVYVDATQALGLMTEAEWDQIHALERAVEVTDDYRERVYDASAYVSGPARDSMDGYTAALQMKTEALMAASEAEREVAEAARLSGVAFADALASGDSLEMQLYDMAVAAGEDSRVLSQLAYDTGEFTTDTILAALKAAEFNRILREYSEGAIGIDEARQKLQEFKSTWDNLDAEKVIRLKLDIIGSVPSEFNAPRNDTRGGERQQFGGEVWPGRRYLVGEVGPETFVPGQYGHIVPNNQTINNNRNAGDTIIINDAAAMAMYLESRRNDFVNSVSRVM